MTQDEIETLWSAIKATEYKYFGDYELSPDQSKAVDTLVEFAKRHLQLNQESSIA